MTPNRSTGFQETACIDVELLRNMASGRPWPMSAFGHRADIFDGNRVCFWRCSGRALPPMAAGVRRRAFVYALWILVLFVAGRVRKLPCHQSNRRQRPVHQPADVAVLDFRDLGRRQPYGLGQESCRDGTHGGGQPGDRTLPADGRARAAPPDPAVAIDASFAVPFSAAIRHGRTLLRGGGHLRDF